MVNSITYMFREISVTQQIHNQWKSMRIKCKEITGLRKIKKKTRKNLGIQTEESESSLQRQSLQMLTMHIKN